MRVVVKSKSSSSLTGQSPQKTTSTSSGHELTSPDKSTGKKSQSLAIFLNKGIVYCVTSVITDSVQLLWFFSESR